MHTRTKYSTAMEELVCIILRSLLVKVLFELGHRVSWYKYKKNPNLF